MYKGGDPPVDRWTAPSGACLADRECSMMFSKSTLLILIILLPGMRGRISFIGQPTHGPFCCTIREQRYTGQCQLSSKQHARAKCSRCRFERGDSALQPPRLAALQPVSPASHKSNQLPGLKSTKYWRTPITHLWPSPVCCIVQQQLSR